jgi:hypothetical protein
MEMVKYRNQLYNLINRVSEILKKFIIFEILFNNNNFFNTYELKIKSLTLV